MLSERARREVLAELIGAAERLLHALRESDPTEIAASLSDAGTARANLNDGYVCDMSRAFDEIESCIATVTHDAHADSEIQALRHAVDMARGYVSPVLADAYRWRSIDVGGTAQITVWGEPQRQTVYVEAKSLCDRFGARLVAALLRVMAGLDRIASLLDFIRLNATHVRQNSIEYERNFHFAALESFAYLKELSEATTDLSGAGIERALRDTDPWLQLKAIQREWRGALPSAVRNEVMFHLGNLEEVTTYLQQCAQSAQRMPLLESDVDGKGLETRFSAGSLAVLLAGGLTLADYGGLADRAVQSYGPLVSSVARIADDLLRQCGARLPALETRMIRLLPPGRLDE
jgi:hypothetical protein